MVIATIADTNVYDIAAFASVETVSVAVLTAESRTTSFVNFVAKGYLSKLDIVGILLSFL